MNSSASSAPGVALPVPSEETLGVALLLAFAGGYLDAYTWIVHGVMANAQTANLVLLWVHGVTGNWKEAWPFVPPMLAFAVGIVAAFQLRRILGQRAGAISTVIEIVLLVIVGVLHNRLPDVAGTLGISFVAAMQAANFTKVEGLVYSSVMITGNFRQSVEAGFGAISGQPHMAGRSGIFGSLCLAFGAGAASGALMTKWMPSLTLVIPIVALLIVLLLCERKQIRDWRLC